MGRRFSMIEEVADKFTITYPLEKHNIFNKKDHDNISSACEDLLRSIILFSYDGDRINIYLDPKYFRIMQEQIRYREETIKLKKLDIRLKDLGDKVV